MRKSTSKTNNFLIFQTTLSCQSLSGIYDSFFFTHEILLSLLACVYTFLMKKIYILTSSLVTTKEQRKMSEIFLYT